MDITERKLTAETLEHQVKSRTIQLTRANNALVMANQQLEQFVFISSHDLHEPVRKIQTFANILASEESNQNPRVKKYLDKIDASASRMVTLLNDLQSFSALKDDPSKFTVVDLNAVIRDVIKDFGEEIERTQATFSISFIPAIYGDRVQMHQLFSQLVGNALKFNKGNPVIAISSAVATEDDFNQHPELRTETAYVSIAVKDNGIGFDQKYAPKLFILFQQLKDIHARGTGIGLAISKRIIDNHRGFIFAKGKVNEGATFTVFLPAERWGKK
jgi:signal transduction histidine kinase